MANWASKTASDLKDSKNKSSTKKEAQKKSKILPLLESSDKGGNVEALTQVPSSLREFALAATSSIETNVCCKKVFYSNGSSGEARPIKVGENLILLSFAFFVESYIACCVSPSEQNLIQCYGQYKVAVPYADFDDRYAVMLKHAPINAVKDSPNHDQAITDAHDNAKKNAHKLSEMVRDMSPVEDIRKLLATVKCCVITSDKCGTTEQAHRLKTALSQYKWGNFKEGTDITALVTFEAYLPSF